MAVILIIDDSPTEAQIITKILESGGYEVIWADNAAKGIEIAERQKPALILMDVVMPGMSGFQATRKLTRSSITKDIPVVMLTTKDQETDKIWGLRNGAREYMVKPPEKELLLAKISECLR